MPYLQDEPIVQQGCPLTTGNPQVNLVAEIGVAAVGVAQVLGAQAVEGLPSGDQLHFGDASTHVVLHAVQVEDGDHAGPIGLARVVGLQAAGARTQQSCRKFGKRRCHQRSDLTLGRFPDSEGHSLAHLMFQNKALLQGQVKKTTSSEGVQPFHLFTQPTDRLSGPTVFP